MEGLAVVEEAQKVCNKCAADKKLDLFPKVARGKMGRRAVCKACRNIEIAAWHKENAEQVKARLIEYWKKNAERNRAKSSRWLKAASEQLTDQYLVRQLTKTNGIPKGDVTEDLISVKRLQLTARRLARQLKKATDESSKDTDRITGKHGAGRDAGRLAPNRCQQPAGTCPQGDQRHGCGSDGEGAGLDKQQPER